MSKEADPAEWKRLKIIYRILAWIINQIVRRKFNFTCDDFDPNSVEGPMIIIPNHSCAWDPLLMAAAFRKRQMFFVMSEHVLRKKIIGPLINYLGAPIPRRKASSGTSAVMSCLRHLRAGHSVCLFAEGEQTWDGVSGKSFPGTAKLVKQSGATLVTYRLEGAYLSLPRWAKGVRRGRVQGRTIGVYTPDKLKDMKPSEISGIIDRDLAYDIWRWQDDQTGGPVRFVQKGLRAEPAGYLHKALFICPSCRKLGKLTGAGSSISCSCGFRVKYTQTGFFDPPKPFRTIAEWDDWDRSELGMHLEDALKREGRGVVCQDTHAVLSIVEAGHRDRAVTAGQISLAAGNGTAELSVGNMSFDITRIGMMAPILSDILMFSAEGAYYQITAQNTNLRKYNMAWEFFQK